MSQESLSNGHGFQGYCSEVTTYEDGKECPRSKVGIGIGIGTSPFCWL